MGYWPPIRASWPSSRKEIMRKLLALAACLLIGSAPAVGQTARRPLALEDHSRIVAVGDPQRSPDGQWVAYTVTTIDAEKDRRNTDIWMVKWDGSETLQLTSSPDGESTPRWSPDNKYLAFVASRGSEEEKKKGGQINIKILKLLDLPAKTIQFIEKGIYNYVIEKCSANSIIPIWENAEFVDMYVS